MILNIIKKYRFFLFLSAIFILLRLPSLFEPYWYGDEGIYLVLGQAIRKGWVLYSQIHDNKPPTLYFLAAISQTVFGFRLLLALWMIPTIYVFHRLADTFLNIRLTRIATILFLIITSIPLLEGSIANAEVFMLLPTLWAALILLRHQNNLSLIFSGLLLGFAFTIKIPVFIEFAFLAMWLVFVSADFNIKKINIISSLQKVLIFSLSFIFPIVLYLIYFSLKGAFDEFMFAALFQNFGYLSSWSTSTQSSSLGSGGLFTRVLILGLFWIILLFLVFRKKISHQFSFIAFWFSATIFGSLMSARPYPHYLLQTIPPFVLLLFFLFKKPTSLLSRNITLILFVLFGYFFIHYKFYVYPVFSYYSNFYSHVTNLNSDTYRNYFGSDVSTSYQVSQYVQQHTNPNDKIFVWGDNPSIYALADRLPVGKYTVAYHVADFNQYDSIYNQLKINYPPYIISYFQSNHPYPDLDIFLSRYYRPVQTYGQIIIYQRLL